MHVQLLKNNNTAGDATYSHRGMGYHKILNISRAES